MVSTLGGLKPDDQHRVLEAIAAAQARSHARLVFVVVRASDRYQLYPVLWGAVVAFLALGVVALLYPHMNVRLAFVSVTILFFVLSLIFEWRPLRLWLAPRHVKHAHARALAHREFAARILSQPELKGGVLFFASLAERYSEVIADRALHEAAGQAPWDKIVANFTTSAARGELTDGFVAGAKACGDILEHHHPKA